jgi:hypothetical protein
MWNWFNCYLSGQHEYVISCEPGAVFLRCPHCGRRTPGWAVEGQTLKSPVRERSAATGPRAVARATRIIPFIRSVAR